MRARIIRARSAIEMYSNSAFMVVARSSCVT